MSSPDDRAPPLGTVISGRYRLDEVAGRGAFGVVYKARHLTLDTEVAVKVLTRLGRAESPVIDQVLAESRVLHRLQHPNIVAVLDAGIHGDVPYYVMDWCDGPTLEQLIARGARQASAAWLLLRPVALALAHAHRSGVVHGDVKPSNIVLQAGTPRLLDFGTAALVPRDVTATATSRSSRSPRSPRSREPAPFTPGYAATEQLAGSPITPETDVHALALLFVELVVGSAAVASAEALIDPRRPTPRQHGIDVGALEGVLARALALRPSDRFPHADAFVAAVDAALGARTGRWTRVVAVGLVGIVGLAFLTIVLVGASLAPITLARGPAGARSGDGAASDAATASSSTVAPDAASRRLHEVSTPELRARLSRAGFGECAATEASDGIAITCAGARLTAWRAPTESVEDAVRRAKVSALDSGWSGELFIDGDYHLCIVASDLARAASAVAAADEVDQRLPVEDAPLPPADAVKLGTLASWTGFDVTRAVRRIGVHRRTEDPSADAATLVIGNASTPGGDLGVVELRLASSPHTPKSVVLQERRMSGPIAYAIGGDRVLTVSGSYATEAFVRSILNGARADEIGTLK